MLETRNLKRLLFGALLSAAAITACDKGEPGQGDAAYATESDPCHECQAILVECTSTSRDEAQFIQCRDQWQECQNGRGLKGETCGNPGDGDACDLCRARMTECKAADGANASKCDEEFGICKAYLITRGDVQQQCTATSEGSPEVACGVCQKDVAVCLSDITLDNAAAVCAGKFENCVGANALLQGQCSAPTADKACGLCTDQHAECVASSGPTCSEGFTACADGIAADVTCELDTTGTGGAGGMGGAGGSGGAGGGTDGGCSHDVCVEGEALVSGCGTNSCVADVCALDNFCCEDSWDAFCVQKAVDTPSCGCS